MKKNSRISIVLILIGILAAFVVKNTFFEKTEIQNDTTIEVLQSKELLIETYVKEGDFSEEELAQRVQEEREAALKSACILKVIPTGNLYFNHSVIMQEVKVDVVAQGQCEEETIWICIEGSTIETHGEDAYCLVGLDYALMQPENTYLVFCAESEINPYSNKKLYKVTENLWFPYYNLDTNCDKVMVNETYEKEMEFFTDSELVLEYFNTIKMEVLKKFIHI